MSDLVGNPEERFCRDAAQITNYVTLYPSPQHKTDYPVHLNHLHEEPITYIWRFWVSIAQIKKVCLLIALINFIKLYLTNTKAL